MATTEECRAELLEQLKSKELTESEIDLIQKKLFVLQSNPDIDN